MIMEEFIIQYLNSKIEALNLKQGNKIVTLFAYKRYK